MSVKKTKKTPTYEECLAIKQEIPNNSRKFILEKFGITKAQYSRILNDEFDLFGVINENTTVLRKLPLIELKELIANSESYSEVIRKCNLDVRASYIETLKNIITRYFIDADHFNLPGKYNKGRTYVSNEELFIVNDKCQHTVKSRIVKEKLIPYVCTECGNGGFYNNKPLVLQLDHINGNNKDNRLENLRFLCANCHSQTDNFTARNIPRKINNCINCGIKISKKSIRCKKCGATYRSESGNDFTPTSRRKFEVSKEILEVLIKEKPMTEIGKMFGVSDNAIRSRCELLGIELKGVRGRWRKVETGKIQIHKTYTEIPLANR
jgi:hypothetical protein